jgi:hypothetical protein
MVLLESESGEGAREVSPGSAEAGRLGFFLIVEKLVDGNRYANSSSKSQKLEDELPFHRSNLSANIQHCRMRS